MCGVGFSGGCGNYSYVGSGSVCGGSLVKPPRTTHPSSCGIATFCGNVVPSKREVEPKGSLGSEMIARLNSSNTCGISICDGSKIPDVRTVYVYDVDIDNKVASCLVDNHINGYHYYKNKDVEFDKLRKFVKKGNFDAYELKGFRIKKDGEFKIKTKELKANKDMLEKEVENFKSHFKHMVEVKKELKAEREVDENEENMER